MIRAVTANDLEMWRELWLGYQRFYKADIPEAVSQKTWERLLDPAESMSAALAFDGARAVGLVQWLFHRSTWSTADYCYLQDLFVAEDVRRGGVGRALIEHVYADATRAGAARVYWHTHETNETAMKLYDRVAEKSGFLSYKRQLA